ncbi:protein kinase [Nocardia sp. NPDC050408]|uniref:protein kinase domain-containing protein n=1 Tax=Nocardia sp. NPDC050408 TaxID=3364319 RepID=UPI0037A4F8ED
MSVPDVTTDLLGAGLHEAVQIGAGGFGSVYRCIEHSLGRVVAVKVLLDPSASEGGLKRFAHEQETMGRLSGHPNIIAIHRVGVTAAGRPFLVMPHYEQGSLDQLIRSCGPCSLSQILRFGVKLSAALEFAHSNGVLHRDVKPSNILLSQFGEPILADFGIARREGELLTRTGIVLGSPAFNAPEVLGGQAATPAADVYSLGAVLFCMLTGHAVAERRAGEELFAQFIRVTDQPISGRSLLGASERVAATIELAMQLDPSNRPASASALGRLLQQLELETGMEVDPLLVPGSAPFADRTATITTNGRAERDHLATAPPTIPAKYQPIPISGATVIRRRLLDRLYAGGRRRLILIHGPAGFGKSTLAAQWQACLARDGVPAAWLSLDSDDDNPVWFLDHLLQSLRRVRPDLPRIFSEELASQGRRGIRTVLTQLLAAVHEHAKRTVLIVDDWHWISSAETTEAMVFLLSKGCDHLQVVITSRSRKGLPLASMRVRDELVEIDSSALRFDASESGLFLLRSPQIDLSAAEVETLHNSTDGWPAALQLALLAIQSCGQPDTVIHQIDNHQEVAEYLTENVLNTLEPSVLDFMLVTSLTTRTCGELASELSGVTTGAQLLEEIRTRDLFLRRTEEDPEWYRYHHLFSEFLRQRLRRIAPERYKMLHRSAADWFSRNGFLNDAVEHALAADEPVFAAELIESRGRELIEQSRMATLLALVGRLPTDLAATLPELQVHIAWAHTLLHHRPQQVSRALTLACAQLRAGPASMQDETSPLQVEISVVQAVADCFSDRVERVGALVAQCLKHPEQQSPLVTSAASNVATFAAIAEFDFDQARRWQEWAAPYHEQTSAPFSVVYGTCLAGIAAWEQLDLDAAEEYFRNAVLLAQQGIDGADSYAVRLAGALLGDLLYQVGDIDRAEELLARSRELGAEGGLVDFKCATYGTGALLLVGRGDADGARRLLDEGAEIALALRLPRLGARLARDRFKCGFGTDQKLSGLFNGTSSAPSDASTIVDELRREVRIRELLARGETGPASAEAAILRTAIDRSSRPRAALEADLLRTLCFEHEGQEREAESLLEGALQTCVPRGLSQFVADIDESIVRVAIRVRNGSSGGSRSLASSTHYRDFLDLVTGVSGKADVASRTHPQHHQR